MVLAEGKNTHVRAMPGHENRVEHVWSAARGPCREEAFGRTPEGATSCVSKEWKRSERRCAAYATEAFGGVPLGATSR
eukprot:8431362-Pyramimonas_sp.AAC.1